MGRKKKAKPMICVSHMIWLEELMFSLGFMAYEDDMLCDGECRFCWNKENVLCEQDTRSPRPTPA